MNLDDFTERSLRLKINQALKAELELAWAFIVGLLLIILLMTAMSIYSFGKFYQCDSGSSSQTNPIDQRTQK